MWASRKSILVYYKLQRWMLHINCKEGGMRKHREHGSSRYGTETFSDRDTKALQNSTAVRAERTESKLSGVK
jgi:hypothetical protein